MIGLLETRSDVKYCVRTYDYNRGCDCVFKPSPHHPTNKKLAIAINRRHAATEILTITHQLAILCNWPVADNHVASVGVG